MVGRVVYFRGDAARITGEAETIHGGRFYPAVLLEGHREGIEIVISERLVEMQTNAEGGQS